MTAGTKVIRRALGYIGADSPLNHANPESINDVKDILNSMIAEWYDLKNIDMGCSTLELAGDELSEPLGARNGIEYNLAVRCEPLFEGLSASNTLLMNAKSSFSEICKTYRNVNIPAPTVRNTLPLGMGKDKSYFEDEIYASTGDKLG